MGKSDGSVKRAAVAGTDRGTRNVPGRLGEKTESTVAPFIPPTSPPTSAATMEFYKYTINK